MEFLSVEVLTMVATILGSNGIIYLIAKTMLTRWSRNTRSSCTTTGSTNSTAE